MSSKQQPTKRPHQSGVSLEQASTGDLVREAFEEAKELVRIEVEIAKTELAQDLARAKRAAVGFAIAAGAGVLVVCLLAMALVLALGGTALIALAVAGGFLVAAGLSALVGYSILPKDPMKHTRQHFETDVNELKEHIA